MTNDILNRVHKLAIPILSEAGLELVEIQFRREKRGWVLRVFIDKEGGVTLDDCANISREIGRVLDIEDFISVPYILEVSSPGLTRPLKDERDFLRYRGRLIKVKTFSPVEEFRQFKGRLLGITDRNIELEVEGRILCIPISNVAKANLEIDF